MLSERAETGPLGGAGRRGGQVEGGLGYGLANSAMDLQRRVTGAGKRKGLNPVKQVD